MVIYDGKNIKFESVLVNTDANGEATITLDDVPFDAFAMVMWCPDAVRMVEFVSLSGVSLTVRIRILPTKTNATLGDLPGGVSSQPTQTTTGGRTLGPTNPTSAGDTGAVSGTHSHNWTWLYEHDHLLVEDTSLLKAESENNIRVTIIYMSESL